MKNILAIVCLMIGFQMFSYAQEATKISVEGNSELKILPDEALINVSLKEKALKTAEATEGLNQKAAEVTKALKKSGVENYELKADNYYINVNRVYTKGTSKDSGYVASQNLKILVKNTEEDLVKIMEALHANIDMGFQLSFQLSDSKRKEYQDELLRMALLDAKSKAMTIANTLDLGAITVQEVIYGSGGNIYQPKAYRNEAMMVSADNQRTAPTIQPDEQTLSDQIKVVFTFSKE